MTDAPTAAAPPPTPDDQTTSKKEKKEPGPSSDYIQTERTAALAYHLRTGVGFIVGDAYHPKQIVKILAVRYPSLGFDPKAQRSLVTKYFSVAGWTLGEAGTAVKTDFKTAIMETELQWAERYLATQALIKRTGRETLRKPCFTPTQDVIEATLEVLKNNPGKKIRSRIKMAPPVPGSPNDSTIPQAEEPQAEVAVVEEPPAQTATPKENPTPKKYTNRYGQTIDDEDDTPGAPIIPATLAAKPKPATIKDKSVTSEATQEPEHGTVPPDVILARNILSALEGTATDLSTFGDTLSHTLKTAIADTLKVTPILELSTALNATIDKTCDPAISEIIRKVKGHRMTLLLPDANTTTPRK